MFVSVIIPCYRQQDQIEAAVTSLFDVTEYPDGFEAILVSNAVSNRGKLFQLQEKYGTVIRLLLNYDNELFTRAVLDGTLLARGEAVCWLNQDCQIIEPDWLSRMAALLRREGVGAVGCKLVFPPVGGRYVIQHAGAIGDESGGGAHLGRLETDGDGVYDMERELFAGEYVTGACLLTWRKFHPFLKEILPRAPHYGSDRLYCARLLAEGYRIWYCPCRVIHLEHGGQKTV